MYQSHQNVIDAKVRIKRIKALIDFHVNATLNEDSFDLLQHHANETMHLHFELNLWTHYLKAQKITFDSISPPTKCDIENQIDSFVFLKSCEFDL